MLNKQREKRIATVNQGGRYELYQLGRIDVSNGKSMVAILRPMGEFVMLPKEYLCTVAGLCQLSADIRSRRKYPCHHSKTASLWRYPPLQTAVTLDNYISEQRAFLLFTFWTDFGLHIRRT